MHTQSTSAPTPVAPALVSADGRTYPLEASRLVARAEGGMALSTLHQHFRNPHPEALEVVYTMPLPADGAVLGYTILIGDRRIEGVVRSREDAARAYREALYEGRTTGLLEQERADTFTQKLGNIPPGTDVSVEIQVLHPLAFRPAEVEQGVDVDPDTFQHPYVMVDPLLDHAAPGVFEPSWEYRFPTVTGVRYMGGPGEVPDAGRLSPDRASGGTPARFTLDLVLADALDARSVWSPSHRLSCRARGPGDEGRGPAEGVGVTLSREVRLDRDLVVQWSAATPDVGLRIVEGGGLPGDGGRYALVTLVPPAVPRATVPRDVTVLLDTSGSMTGLPLEVGKQVIQVLLESLDHGDRFEILTFGSRVGRLTPGLVPAHSPALERALSRMHAEQANGHTDMRAGVEQALHPLREDGQRQVVLVTDGYIGFEKSVVASLLAGLSRGSRFHAVGVGAAPNRTLTGGLARAGRGVELFASDLATAHTAAEHLVAATRRPVLTDVRVSGDGVVHAAPIRPRDVLEGQPLVLTAELSSRGGTLLVEGVLAGRPGVWRRSVEVTPADDRPSRVRSGRTILPVGAIHGREVIADLELEEAGGVSRELTDQAIERAGLRHRIVSRRTSLVAVSETPTVDPRNPTRRETLVVELPDGLSAEGLGLLDRSPSPGWGAPAGEFGSVLQASLSWAEAPAFEDFEGEDRIAYRSAPPAPGAPKRSAPLPPPKLREARVVPDETPSWEGGGGPGDLEAEVVVHTPDRLVVEFQVPRAGFRLPQQEVTLRLPDGRLVTALVQPSGSTHGGPHPAGVRVRLDLRAPGGRTWDEMGFPPAGGGNEDGPLRVGLLWTGGVPGA